MVYTYQTVHAVDNSPSPSECYWSKGYRTGALSAVRITGPLQAIGLSYNILKNFQKFSNNIGRDPAGPDPGALFPGLTTIKET